MWGRIAFVSVLGWLMLQPVPAFSQGKPTPAAISLWQQQKIVRPEIISGRLQIMQLRQGQSRTFQAGDPEGGNWQSLKIISLGAGLITVQSEAVEPGERTSLALDERNNLVLTRESATETFTWRQSAKGDLSFELAVGRTAPRRQTAVNLWQFALTEPQLFETKLVPLLETIRPDWQLIETAQAVRQKLLQTSHVAELNERQQWSQWVAELASDDFKTRQAADLSLRDLGLPVIRFLERSAKSELEPEQRKRISRMVQALTEPKAYVPEIVAEWFVDEPAIWLALLQSEIPSEQATAKEHLANLLGQPVLFDSLASASDRRQQVARLKKQLIER